LLRRALQSSTGFGIRAEALNRCLDVASLHDISLSYRCRPVGLLTQETQNFRIVSDSLNAQVPVLAFDQALVNLSAHQALGFHNLIAEARSGQNLSQQRIGIKRNRRQHLIEFIAVKGGGGL
jgi:hypothetical protein